MILMKRLRMGDLVTLLLKLLEADTFRGMQVIVMTPMAKSGSLGLQKTSASRKCQLQLIR